MARVLLSGQPSLVLFAHMKVRGLCATIKAPLSHTTLSLSSYAYVDNTELLVTVKPPVPLQLHVQATVDH